MGANKAVRRYVDNAQNRRLGLVGKVIPSKGAKKVKPDAKKRSVKKPAAKKTAKPASASRGCTLQTQKKYTGRPSPPYPANECCWSMKKGNNSKLFLSVPDKNGVCRWYQATDKLLEKHGMLGKKVSSASSPQSKSASKRVRFNLRKNKSKSVPRRMKKTGCRNVGPPCDYGHYAKMNNKGITCCYKMTAAQLKKTVAALKNGEALEYNDWMREAERRNLVFSWDKLKKMKKGQRLSLVPFVTQGNYTSFVAQNDVLPPELFFAGMKEQYVHGTKIPNENRYFGKLGGEEYEDGLFYEYKGNAVTGSGADFALLWSGLSKMPPVYYK